MSSRLIVLWVEGANMNLCRKRSRRREIWNDEERRRIQGREKKERKGKEDIQEEARTPAICHGDLTYPRRILSSALIAASVIQAEDKRARNKIRTGSTGLPYSPLRRAPASQGWYLPPFPPALSGEKEAISPTFPGSERTFFLYYERKLRLAGRHRRRDIIPENRRFSH